MSYQKQMMQENESMQERYELSMERIEKILEEESVKEPYLPYFRKVSEFILKIKEVVDLAQSGRIKELSFEELKTLNEELYDDISKDNGHAYEISYANTTYAVSMLGEKYGKLLSFLYTEIRGLIAYAFELRLFDITIALELFIEIYNYFEEEEDETYEFIRSAIYFYISDYSDVTIAKRLEELLNTEFCFATEIIMESDLTDLRYLYYFGEYITENEVKTAAYLNSLQEEQIEALARTYTEGFRIGFLNANIDLSKKSVVNIRYSLGFERIVRAAIRQFSRMGLSTTIYRAAVSSIHKKQSLKIGYFGTSPNRQYDYDHRFDDALFLDKALIDRKLVNSRVAYEKFKDLGKEYAGPAVIEIFGQNPFSPLNKQETPKLSEKQKKLKLRYNQEINLIANEYLKYDEISFTIIAYPVPEIGENYEAIFNEVVKVNTLDLSLYEKIQQTMIDVLDQGEYVRVAGAGRNKTDIKIMLHNIGDKEKETIFENCLADVNIPVGEVFTTPVLKGTNGVIHVEEVYLNELKYTDLELHLKDGMITEYTCKNFSEEEQNTRFIKENLLFEHDTLPLGEFAIGTNTTAYCMAKKYNIMHKLPILIAEKMGPHFAMGDTCYCRSEEKRVFNPNGKEIIAKDNEYSILRKTEVEKAYFNCHTDISIPYDELDEISVYHTNGEKTEIIKNGRFVLKGTEELNKF